MPGPDVDWHEHERKDFGAPNCHPAILKRVYAVATPLPIGEVRDAFFAEIIPDRSRPPGDRFGANIDGRAHIWIVDVPAEARAERTMTDAVTRPEHSSMSLRCDTYGCRRERKSLNTATTSAPMRSGTHLF